MPLPERNTPEFAAGQQRVYRHIMDLASNIAVRKHLPPAIHVLIFDAETGERFGSDVGIEYLFSGGTARITTNGINLLLPTTPVVAVADALLSTKPGVPLVCDTEIADELSRDSLTWVTDGHYRLEGRPGGVLEVYTPYAARKLSQDQLPPGTTSGQIFEE